MTPPLSNGHYLPYHPFLRPLAARLRRETTRAENRVWYDFLRTQRPPWHRQKPLDRFIADFYCARLRLVLEVDGPSHEGTEAASRDAVRTAALEACGLVVVRVSNADVLQHFDATCHYLTAFFAERLWHLRSESPTPSGHPL